MQLIKFIGFLKRNFSFLFLLSLLSFGLLFSMISSYMGFMGEDNLFASIIRKVNFFLALIGIVTSIGSGLYQKFLTREMVFLFLLYIYYIFIVKDDISNIDAKGIVLDAQEKNLIMLRMTRLVFFPLLAVLLFRVKDLKLFRLAKAILISLTISLILALVVLEVTIGSVVDERLSIEGELNSLNMGYWGATLFMMCLFYVIKEKNKTQKYILGAISLIIALYIMLISGSRGPIIYSFIIFYYFILNTSAFSSIKKYVNAILILTLILVLIDYTFLTDVIGLFNPALEERIISTIVDNEVSGRDRLYVIALDQFYSSPFFGDFFLLTSGHYKGEYPHNILLEALMTLGLFGALPFFYLLIQTFKRVHLMIKINDNTTWIGLLFLVSFFKGLSTWNLYGNTLLWVSMAIILSFKYNFLKFKLKK
jgi:O-antigen ligase